MPNSTSNTFSIGQTERGNVAGQPERSTREPTRLPLSAELVALSVIFGVTICAFFYPIVFLDKTFLPLSSGSVPEVMGSANPWQFPGQPRLDDFRIDLGASAWQIQPAARQIAAAYAAGEVPLWNPHQGFGAPLAANAISGAFDILRLPVLLNASPLAWDFYYLARTVLGLGLTYAFARSIGLSFPARLTVAFAYVLSGFTFVLGNNHYLEIYFLLPGMLWGTEAILQNHVRSGILALAVTTALSTLAGMPESTLMTFLYAAAYGAFRLLLSAYVIRTWRAIIRPGTFLTLAWIAGLGLAAPLAVPLAEYIGQSHNLHDASQQLGLTYWPLSRVAFRGMPYILGHPLTFLDGMLIGLFDYSGSAVLMLAAFGAMVVHPPRLAPARLFALVSAALLAAKFFGVPLVNDLGRLPLLNLTWIGSWGSPLLTLSLAILAGFGVDAIRRGNVGRLTKWLVLALFGAYVGVSVGLNWPALSQAGFIHAVPMVGLALLTAGLICVSNLLWSGPHGRLAASACCAIVVGELFVLAPHDIYQDRYDPLTKPPYVQFLQEQVRATGPFRVFATGGLLYPNFATAFGIDDIRSLDALYPQRYFDFVQAFLAPGAVDRYTGGPGSAEGQTVLDGNKWFNLAGVRMVVQSRDAVDSTPFNLVYNDEVSIFQNPAAFPRAFLVQSARSVRDRDEAIGALRTSSFDPAREAVVEGPVPPDIPASASACAACQARIISYADDRIVVSTESTDPALLVIADTYYPGWQARVDGQTQPIYPTDLAFQGVFVGPGVHQVELSYAPLSFRLGLAGALLGALVLVIGCVLGPRWRDSRGALADVRR